MNEGIITNDKQSSIEVTKTSKGSYSWKTKLYFNEEEHSTASIVDKLKITDEYLESKFGE